jgi:hypothetical protein
MKLYVLEFISEYGIRFPVTLEVSDSGADEGNWFAPPTAIYLGQTSGYWKTNRGKDSLLNLWLLEDADPNLVSWLWRDSPLAVAAVNDILKLPLFLGETGYGTVMPRFFDSFLMRWKVIGCGF